jgi:hypothetical protein
MELTEAEANDIKVFLKEIKSTISEINEGLGRLEATLDKGMADALGRFGKIQMSFDRHSLTNDRDYLGSEALLPVSTTSSGFSGHRTPRPVIYEQRRLDGSIFPSLGQ